MSPEQLFGELEVDGRVVVSDLEAGLGTLLRLQPGYADLVLVVANPTTKSLEVTRRGVAVASSRGAEVIVVANRVRDADDLALIRKVAGHHEVAVVPDDAVIERADRDGRAPIDLDAKSRGVRALSDLARRVLQGA